MPMCSKCKTDLPASGFFPSDKYTCKPCRYARTRERYAADPELRERRHASDSAFNATYQPAYRAAHREKLRLQSLQRRKDNPEWYKQKHKDYALKKNFGITPKQYNDMLDKQNGTCPGCGRTQAENTAKRRLSVDHDHTTNVVRGLLCDKCNRIVGLADDLPAVLRALADYLDFYVNRQSGVTP